MSILFTALALVAAPAPATTQPAMPATHAMPARNSPHAQISQPGAKPMSGGCACCKDMAASGHGMKGGAKARTGHGMSPSDPQNHKQ